MNQTILITGGAGLIGAECCTFFAEKNWNVISVDNYFRAKLFGKEGNTKRNTDSFKNQNIEHHEMDFRDEKIIPLLKKSDAIIHAAAQPSHPKSVEIPILDFEINATGTLELLERVREFNPKIPFVFCSTNKVYGDKPNSFEYQEKRKRFEPEDKSFWNGFDESLSVDQCMHTPFGASKLSADIYVQEYARLYGLKTGSFRLGCITGETACAVEQQNWLPFFYRKVLSGEKLSIYGYNGLQVRDLLHAHDLAKLFHKFIKNPKPGEVYNVGGGRNNSISLLEAIDLIEGLTGKKMNYSFASERDADHQWWISDTSKAEKHFSWKQEIDLRNIFSGIFESVMDS